MRGAGPDEGSEDEIAGEPAGHEHLAVGEVDQPEYAVDQGVAEGDQRVEEAVGETLDVRAQKLWVKHMSVDAARRTGPEPEAPALFSSS